MPIPIISGYDKANLSRQGDLALAPVIFTYGGISHHYRHQTSSWRCLGYVPNLSVGVSKRKSADEKQVEHHLCLREIFRDFEDLCKVGGFRTTIRGKKVVLKFFIQYIVGDTAGHNDLTLHFQMNSGCRCCHCPPDKLSVLDPDTCKPLTMKDIVNTDGNYHKLKAIS